MSAGRVLVRAANWLGDGILSMPALEQIRGAFPDAHLAVLARPSVMALYAVPFVNEVIPYAVGARRRDLSSRWAMARDLRSRRFDTAILFQNAFDAAAIVWLARIPVRIGYDRSGRGPLLTHPVPVRPPGRIPRHQRNDYLDLLRGGGVIAALPAIRPIRLPGFEARAERGRARLGGAWIGVAPGSANGTAKRWLPDRFAEAAVLVARRLGARVAVFGSPAERELCERVAAAVRAKGIEARGYAGDVGLDSFLDLAAGCVAFITNDSGAMHAANALGVPTVAVFGPTDHRATGPTGGSGSTIRESVECSPCLRHECPIDHRCMTAVTAERVADGVLTLLDDVRAAAV
jgi:heptosyltransferase-2